MSGKDQTHVPVTETSSHVQPAPPPPHDQQHHQPGPPSSSSVHPPPAPADPTAEKWGTHIMGAPAVPTCHPGNKKAAMWSAGDQGGSEPTTTPEEKHHRPYLQYAPVEKPNSSPMESILHKFNSWSRKAESTANNIWHNLKTAPSVPGAAWDKVNLTAKAITGGGFETLYKQTFATFPDEKLKKTFACYLSTTTGPVAGTLYLSNLHVAFCSDRPLSFTAPSGQVTWSYYKVMVPLSNIGTVNPVVMRDNSSEKYLQIVTVDGQDFWFMGFVNYEKATHHLSESLGTSVAPGVPVVQQPHQPGVPAVQQPHQPGVPAVQQPHQPGVDPAVHQSQQQPQQPHQSEEPQQPHQSQQPYQPPESPQQPHKP